MSSILERPHREQVRTRILDAATANFERDGYSGASLRRIASDAGFTKGAVYSNFGSKPDLFRQVCAARFSGGERDVVDALGPILDRGGSSDDVIARVSETLTRMLLEDVRWQTILAEFRSVARTDEDIADSYRRLESDRVEQLATLATEHGVVDPSNMASARTLAIAVLGLVNVLALEYSVVSDVVNRDVIRDVIERAIRGFVR